MASASQRFSPFTVCATVGVVNTTTEEGEVVSVYTLISEKGVGTFDTLNLLKDEKSLTAYGIDVLAKANTLLAKGHFERTEDGDGVEVHFKFSLTQEEKDLIPNKKNAEILTREFLIRFSFSEDKIAELEGLKKSIMKDQEQQRVIAETQQALASNSGFLSRIVNFVRGRGGEKSSSASPPNTLSIGLN